MPVSGGFSPETFTFLPCRVTMKKTKRSCRMKKDNKQKATMTQWVIRVGAVVLALLMFGSMFAALFY